MEKMPFNDWLLTVYNERGELFQEGGRAHKNYLASIEKIFDSNDPHHELGDYLGNNYGYKCLNDIQTTDKFKEAMDELKKQHSSVYSDWLDDNGHMMPNTAIKYYEAYLLNFFVFKTSDEPLVSALKSSNNGSLITLTNTGIGWANVKTGDFIFVAFGAGKKSSKERGLFAIAKATKNGYSTNNVGNVDVKIEFVLKDLIDSIGLYSYESEVGVPGLAPKKGDRTQALKSLDYSEGGIVLRGILDNTSDSVDQENIKKLFPEKFINGLAHIRIMKPCYDYPDYVSLLYKAENIIYYGVPGCGKSYKVKEKFSDVQYTERVVFHPDYTYADFIGHILPKKNQGDITYDFVPGPFTRILEKAYKSLYEGKNEHFALIIEELNRGNAPAIFGDLFQMLDRENTGESLYPVTNEDIATEIRNHILDDNRINLADELKNIFKNYPIDKDATEPDNAIERKKAIVKVVSQDAEGQQVEEKGSIFELLNKYKIKIPRNLSIVATMNSSDQNVFSLDTAFQRRWKMILVKNSFDENDDTKTIGEKKIYGTDITWRTFCEAINKMVVSNARNLLSSEDKRLGVFFMNENDFEQNEDGTYSDVFAYKVIKYLWDDAFKFDRWMLFDDKKCQTLEDAIEAFLRPYTEPNAAFCIFNQRFREDIKCKYNLETEVVDG